METCLDSIPMSLNSDNYCANICDNLLMPGKEGTLHHKLHLARKYHRPSLNQDEAAALLNVSRSLVSRYESDEKRAVPLSYVELVRSRLQPGWPIEWFFDGAPGLPREITSGGVAPGFDPPNPLGSGKAPVPGAGRRLFPLVGSVGAAEYPIESVEFPAEEFIEFSEDLFRSDQFVIRIEGDSMYPRFEHGDYILVQPDPHPAPGLIVVIRTAENKFATKVLREKEGQLVLAPINKDYAEIKLEKGMMMVGYAVGHRRERGRGRYLEEGDRGGLRP